MVLILRSFLKICFIGPLSINNKTIREHACEISVSQGREGGSERGGEGEGEREGKKLCDT